MEGKIDLIHMHAECDGNRALAGAVVFQKYMDSQAGGMH